MPVGLISRRVSYRARNTQVVELHGYLAYIVHCAIVGKHYTVYGYRGKQVRDQIHCSDVARLFIEFFP